MHFCDTIHHLLAASLDCTESLNIAPAPAPPTQQPCTLPQALRWPSGSHGHAATLWRAPWPRRTASLPGRAPGTDALPARPWHGPPDGRCVAACLLLLASCNTAHTGNLQTCLASCCLLVDTQRLCITSSATSRHACGQCRPQLHACSISISPPHLCSCATHTLCLHLQACLSLGPAQGQGDRCSPSQEAAEVAEAPTDHQGQRGSCSPSVRIKQYFIVALLILTIVSYYWLGAPAQHISQEALKC